MRKIQKLMASSNKNYGRHYICDGYYSRKLSQIIVYRMEAM